MSIFKCKMCGGTIEFEPGATVGVCDSCGTKQTLPRLDTDRKSNLYDRANHFRRNNDFDKAMGIYEQILNEDNTDAEAYWSLVLCRYGIEYVEDPASHKRIPTVNRAQYTSIYMDEDYKSALQYADVYQRQVYEEEAKAIDDIQKGILEISNKEEPFDVFICYKETDNNGRRTQDSVLANDLYHQLTQEGFKVFFARITLEDKLGTAYEPYIFAALNSLRVGTNCQANMSAIGARTNASPLRRTVFQFGGYLAAYVVQTVIVFIGLAYMIFGLKIKFGGEVPIIFATTALATLLGISLGFMVGNFGSMSAEKKESILVAIILGSCALSGLMMGDMKPIIAEKAPIINKINPAAVISDSYYCLNMFGTGSRFFTCIMLRERSWKT